MPDAETITPLDPNTPLSGEVMAERRLFETKADPVKISADNIEKLQNAGEVGNFLAGLYQTALAEYPPLTQVLIKTSGSGEHKTLGQTGGFYITKYRSKSGHYEAVINTEDGWGHYQDLLETRKTSAEISAQIAGVEFSKFGPKALAAFIFAHELGHIFDELENANDEQARYTRRERDMESLPVRQTNPVELMHFLASERGRNWFNQEQNNFAVQGVHSPAELIRLQEVKYRELETERIPDEFAARVLAKSGLLEP